MREGRSPSAPRPCNVQLNVSKYAEGSCIIETGNTRVFCTASIDENVPSKGGISGKPVQDLSDKLLSYIYKKEKGRFVLIGCGGIFSATDAYRKIRLGASLVQMVTGVIFEGPQVVSEINRQLVRLLRRDGFKNISEARGWKRRMVCHGRQR